MYFVAFVKKNAKGTVKQLEKHLTTELQVLLPSTTHLRRKLIAVSSYESIIFQTPVCHDKFVLTIGKGYRVFLQVWFPLSA
jgi:hypothetical protein